MTELVAEVVEEIEDGNGLLTVGRSHDGALLTFVSPRERNLFCSSLESSSERSISFSFS
jgi:hypothetical protein